jgi:hypothetical protein
MAARAKSTDLYSVVITVPDQEVLRRVLTMPGIDAGCRHPNLRHEKSRIQLCALVPSSLLPQLQRDRTLDVNVIENATEAGKKYFAYVGRGDRFRKGKVLPKGFGKLV